MNRLVRPEDTIEGAGIALRERRATSVSLVQGCLVAIEEWEPNVKAWSVVDRIGAMAQARERDAELRAGQDRGPLHGIPIGIKDIIDVQWLETRLGSLSPRHWTKPEVDAWVVHALREAGAVILGKTVTTPFAWIDPPATRNPWDLDRTPGGSSSGSAAAVATGMCLGAIGSQTGGSITRPASYCGVAGLKPTRGAIPTGGVFPLSGSFDTLGVMARSVGDLALLFRALGRGENGLPFDHVIRPWIDVPRLAQLKGMFTARAEPAMRIAIDRAIEVWSAAGAECTQFDLLDDYEEIRKYHRLTMAAEALSIHLYEFGEDRSDYPPRIAELIEEGGHVSALDYIIARDQSHVISQPISELFNNEKLHAMITPAALGPAPGHSSTGDPIFNIPWSFTGWPTITFPIGYSPEGMPLGVQLVGQPWAEDDLFAVAEWCERAIRPSLIE